MPRSYIADIAGGTATVTIQAQSNQTLKNATFSWTPAAAGKYELSYSGTSQIGTAQPDVNVIARVSIGVLTSGGSAAVSLPINMPIKAFQSIYVHCTGAGNLGTVVLSWVPSETETLLDEAASILEAVQGGGSRVLGGARWFRLAASTRIAFRPAGNRRVTSIRITGGVNVVVSTATTFAQFTALQTGSDNTILMFRSNSTQEGYDAQSMNWELRFADDQNLMLTLDNGGSQVAWIGIYWDFI